MKKRSRRRWNLDGALGSLAAPLFLVDARRKLQFFNAGCEALTGYAAEEVVGRICEYRSDMGPRDAAAVTSALCPPPEVFAGREADVPAYFTRRDGVSQARLVRYFPLQNAQGETEFVLGLIVPIPQPPRAAEPSSAQRLHAELAALRNVLRQRFGPRSLIARSPEMLRVMEQIRLAQSSAVGVLLRGEPGVGKEHVARMIHLESDVKQAAFVPLDCASLSPFDLKQTLKRLFQMSGRQESSGPPEPLPGTLWLKNVEHLPRDLQELIVEQMAQLSASAAPLKGDAPRRLRLMAATTADTERLVQEEVFLREFWCLISALEVELPPLRSRGEELELLAQAFVEQTNRAAAHQIGGLTAEVLDEFRRYHWPGNLDELQAVILEAREVCREANIGRQHLPFRFRTGQDAQAIAPPPARRAVPLDQLLEQTEAEQIRWALEQARYDKSRAARMLGIPRQKLYRRMEALGITDRLEP